MYKYIISTIYINYNHKINKHTISKIYIHTHDIYIQTWQTEYIYVYEYVEHISCWQNMDVYTCIYYKTQYIYNICT